MIVKFSKIRNNRLLNRTQMVTNLLTYSRLLMSFTQINQKSQKKKLENTSELISKSPMSAYSELKNTSEEEEPEDSASSMTTKNHWERSNPLIDWRELNWKNSHQKTERSQEERKKEKKFKKSKSIKHKRKEEPREDKKRTSKESKEKRRNKFPVCYLNIQ